MNRRKFLGYAGGAIAAGELSVFAATAKADKSTVDQRSLIDPMLMSIDGPDDFLVVDRENLRFGLNRPVTYLQAYIAIRDLWRQEFETNERFFMLYNFPLCSIGSFEFAEEKYSQWSFDESFFANARNGIWKDRDFNIVYINNYKV